MIDLIEARDRISEVERRLRALESGLSDHARNLCKQHAKTASGFQYSLMTIQKRIDEAKESLADHERWLDENWKRLEEAETQNEQDG